MYATTFDWLTATPFGVSVLPEVNNRYAVAFPSTIGSDGSATCDNWRPDTTRWGENNLLSGSHSGSGNSRINGLSKRGSKDFKVAAHSWPTTKVLQPDALSIISVLSKGNFGFSGT